jgi:ribosomal protein S18 acetylase RimI-like enzyme
MQHLRLPRETRTHLAALEIVLDTLPSLTAALRIYEQFGFRDIAPYCVNPLEGVRFLGKVLA